MFRQFICVILVLSAPGIGACDDPGNPTPDSVADTGLDTAVQDAVGDTNPQDDTLAPETDATAPDLPIPKDADADAHGLDASDSQDSADLQNDTLDANDSQDGNDSSDAPSEVAIDASQDTADTSPDTADASSPDTADAADAADAQDSGDNGVPPKLYDFRVGVDQPDRIYFKSDKPIVGSDATGFHVSLHTVAAIAVSPDALEGHYLSLTEVLNFWDNTTVRYEGGGDITDTSSRPLAAFTLTYVFNDIPEPASTSERFVTNSAAGGGDGLTESSAWTLAEAFANAEPGETVWMKAGDYGDQNFEITRVGTATNPIKFIGYKATAGDIDSNYWDYGIPFSATEMPTLTGTFSDVQYGRGIYWISSHYVILRNFQMTKYFKGMESGPQPAHANSHLIFDRVNGYDFDQPEVWDTYSSGFVFNASQTGNDHFRFINSVIMEYEMIGLGIMGDGASLIDNVKIYHDNNDVKPDYQMNVSGDFNIIRNSHVEIKGSYYSASTHGIGIRGADKLSNTYNLIEKSTALNLNESFYIRNVGCDYNVIKDCYAGNNGATDLYRGGVYIWGGADHNTIERVVVEDAYVGIGFKDNFEEDSVPAEDFEIGRNNLIRNCTFNNVTRAIQIEEQTEGGDGILYDNQIANCTFHNIGHLFYYDTNLDVQGLEFINCSLSNVAEYANGAPTEGESFTHCNFWDYWGDNGDPPPGVGNISMAPEFVDGAGGDLHLTPASPLVDAGMTLQSVPYDLDGAHRPSGAAHDIGAYELAQ